jgi:Transposase DDE domain
MLIEIFCQIDDFCKQFEKEFSMKLLTDGNGNRIRSFQMSLSEIMTIMIHFHQSGYKTFKDYYEKQVLVHMIRDFHHLVSYSRFVELKQKALLPALIFAQLNACRSCSGISYIDSFPLKACNIKRSSSHKVLRGLAQKGKTSVGWFYGLKLHLVINSQGEIIAFYITSGNVVDNNAKVLVKLTKKLFGKVFGDRGYLTNESLFRKLYSNGVQMVTKIRANMKNKLMPLEDKILLRKRGVIESVGSILKESLSLEHSRHRSSLGFFCHILATIIAYNFRQNKPSIACKPDDIVKIA